MPCSFNPFSIRLHRFNANGFAFAQCRFGFEAAKQFCAPEIRHVYVVAVFSIAALTVFIANLQSIAICKLGQQLRLN